MILADTSIWIEYLRKNQKYFTLMKVHLENLEIFTLECIFGELLQGAKNDTERTLIFEFWNNLPKIDPNGLWLEAGKFSSESNLISKGVGLIDALIIVSARKYQYKIWTLDKKIEKLLNKNETYTNK